MLLLLLVSLVLSNSDDRDSARTLADMASAERAVPEKSYKIKKHVYSIP